MNITTSSEETQQLGQDLAKKIRPGAIVALIGDLGSGKTTFTQGLARGLGIKDKILSPTFILMRQYSIPGKTDGKLFHLDLYRLENKIQIKELGLEEIFTNPCNIVLIEWAEKLDDLTPKGIIKIHFKNLGDEKRQIEIKQSLIPKDSD